MKKVYWIILLFVCLFWFFVYINLPDVVETYAIEASANLTMKKVGIDVDDSRFSFGSLPLGGSSKRYANISNLYQFPIRVEIYTKGNISPFLFASSNEFDMMPNETKRINLTFIPPSDGINETKLPIFYEGEVIFKYIKKN
ncbi:MAG: hypothetical protein PWQ28_48 [Candidatus Woesearchaeota archaeon]|nr:hypothetical protein [Candidatus Woesearchaeota archaeon]MDI3543767.1 hypothetical protein [Candidatus Woesearchaeota archaeon]